VGNISIGELKAMPSLSHGVMSYLQVVPGVVYLPTYKPSTDGLTINGQSLEPLTAQTKEPYRAAFAGRITRSDGYADTPLIVERLREVGVGMVEHVTIRNHSMEPVECLVEFAVGSDFADVFEVKEARVQRQWEESREYHHNTLTIRSRWQDVRKSVVVSSDVAEATREGLRYRTTIPPRGHWSTVVTIAPGTEGGAPAAPVVRPAAVLAVQIIP